LSVRDLVSIALFTAFIAALALVPAIAVPIMVSSVPITVQNFGVMLAGAFLGAKRGAYSILLLLFLAAVGLPVLTGGSGGIGVFLGPTAGYLVGYVFCALTIGWLFERYRQELTLFKMALFLTIGTVFVTYFFGILWITFMFSSGENIGISLLIVTQGHVAFLPGAVIKITVGCFIIKTINKALPDLFQPTKTTIDYSQFE